MTSQQQIRDLVTTIAPDFVKVRHHLHQNPELSYQEAKTSQLVAEYLQNLGVENIRTNVGGYGVTGEVRGIKPGKTLAIRADMDALPIQETNDLPYKSCVPGVMHACGHDGHTSTLLGTAATLIQLRQRFQGTIRLIFQPAEETVNGAVNMCQEGVMDGVDNVIALHGWPGMAVGKMGVRSGPFMASSDTYDITILGRGGHAAFPHVTIDPIAIGTQVVQALQMIASREQSPLEPLVVTIAQFHAGTAYNIIPSIAEIKGTVRCVNPETRNKVPQILERVVAGICAAHRAEYRYSHHFGTPVTYNNPAITDFLMETSAEIIGSDNTIWLPEPTMGAEDFAAYLDYAPGVIFRLGVGENVTPLHTPTYNFADGAVSVGMSLFTNFALRYLGTV